MPSSRPGLKPSVHTSWNVAYSDASRPPQASVTAERPHSESSKFEPGSLQPETSLPKIQSPETIQPQEVYKRAIPLERVVSSPAGLIDAVKKIDRQSPQPTAAAKKIISSKNTKQGPSATDASIAEVIRTALAGTSSAECTSTPTPLPDPGRHSPQDAKRSGDSRISGPNSVAFSAGRPGKLLDLPKKASTSDDPDKSQAEKNVIDVIKLLREQGYVVQKDPSFSSPKIQNQGSAASNKSENQVTCEVCKKFKGRPCELKYDPRPTTS